MLHLTLADFLYILPFGFSLLVVTSGYFKFNSTTSLVKSTQKDKKFVRSHVSKKNYNFALLRFILVVLILLLVQLTIYTGYTGAFWCNHLYINNFVYSYILFFLKVVLFCIFILYNLAVSRIYFSVDYIYSVTVLFIVAPLIFLSNNFFIFYFILELIVCLTFFKFVVSRFFFKNSVNLYNKTSTEKYADYTPKMFINALFFQYWVSFFSSILLLFFFINLEFYFCSTEWVFLNVSSSYIDLPNYFYLYFFFFIVAFFLKLGITPLHLYKIEVYKGLPYVSLYFYTIIFFLVYYFYFIFLFVNNFNMFVVYYWFSFIILIVIGVLYIVCMLFDINFIKSFFAYSTIINAVSFLLVLLAYF